MVVGLAVNLIVWPPLRDRAAWAHAHQLPHELAGVLSEMASNLGPDLASGDVEDWIRRCRELDVGIDEGWGLLRQAKESSRLNPRRSRPADLEAIERALHLLEQSVAETLSLARTISTSADQANVWDDSFRSQWQQLLTATASALDAGDPDQLAEHPRRPGAAGRGAVHRAAGRVRMAGVRRAPGQPPQHRRRGCRAGPVEQ